MARILSDEDVEALALRVAQIIGARLMAEERPKEVPPPPPPVAQPEPQKTAQHKLAYTVNELSAELGISKPTRSLADSVARTPCLALHRNDTRSA